MTEEYNILISFDDRYVDKALTMLYSLKINNNDAKLNIYLFYINLSTVSIEKIQNFFNKYNIGTLYLREYNFDISNFPMYIDHTSVETYIRLFVPFIVEESVKRMLYLDCDIICNASIKELYNLNLEECYFAACENKPPIGSEEFNSVMNENLELPSDNIYVNAGVLLINVEKLKKDFSVNTIMKFVNSNKEILIMQDQDIINKLFYNKIKLFSNIYNYQINGYEDNELIKNPVLIHYSDSLKPWNNNYSSKRKAKYYQDIFNNLKELKNEFKFDKEIDIIIPVYNSKSTLSRALQSVSNLSNKDMIKVYIIDDGSTESYDEVILDYSYKLDILYFKLKKNMGSGYARNYGIDVSNGKYIVFLDSDDYFATKNSVEVIYKKIEDSKLDEVRSTFIRVSHDKETKFIEDTLGTHGKIYRRSFIKDNNIRFSTTKSFEDTYFNTLVFIKNGKIADVDDMTYHWFDNKSSMTNTETIDNKILDYSINMCEILSMENLDMEKWLKVVFDSLYFIYLYYDCCDELLNEINHQINKILDLLDQNDISIDALIDNFYVVDILEFKKFLQGFFEDGYNLINEYNAYDLDKKNEILKRKFAEFGENNIIETPINTNCGGKNLHIGTGVYINFGFSVVDNGNIYIGDNTFIGPNVNILTLNHAVEVSDRQKGKIEIRDVFIGNNVWIGAAVVILPGVKIGDNSVIGAGSVVTKDIPKNALAVGNPCKVIRQINKEKRK